MKGPKNKRLPTRLSYVEYFSTDDVQTVLNHIKDTPQKFGNEQITCKKALTKINASRNWALGEAGKMINAFAGNTSSETKTEVKIDWALRSATLGGTEVFKQKSDDLKGVFSGACIDLKLP